MHQVQGYGTKKHTDNEFNISFEHHYYLYFNNTLWPCNGKKSIITMYRELNCSERIDYILFRPNEVSNHGIKYWDNTYNHNSKLRIEEYNKLTIPLQGMGTKYTLLRRLPMVEEIGVSNCTLKISSFQRYKQHET